MAETECSQAPGLLLRISLWVAQFMVAGPFIFGGFVKLTTPIPELAKAMAWTAQYPALARGTGLIDIAGGIGILLPALLRIRPGLTVVAAIGCMVLQVCAMTFHLSRGEVEVIPMNIAFFALAAFVAWGRSKRATIQPAQ
jgi:hypothetical protein